MITTASPSYATISTDQFKNMYMYPEIINDSLFYAKYIDPPLDPIWP